MSQRLFSICAAGLLFAPVCLAGGGVAAESDIYRILKEHGIPFDATNAHKAAASAVIKAVDRRARVVTKENAAKLAEGETIARSEEWPEGFCYLKLNGLYRPDATQAVARLRDWVDAGKSGLILDLRGAGGTSLEAVDQIAGIFMPGRTELYSLKNGSGRTVETHKAAESRVLPRGTPLMLAIDRDTRDASEILAAALKGRSGIMLIGSSTTGDPGVREAIAISSNEAAFVATRWVALPGNGKYDSEGIKPDIAVFETARTNVVGASSERDIFGKTLSEKAKFDRELMRKTAGDAALERATDILIGLKALGLHGTATNTANSAGQ